MIPLYLFIFVTGDRVTWATARLTRHASPAEVKQAYRKSRSGVEQLFTTIEFDTLEEAELARVRLAQVLRHKFGIGAPSKSRAVKGVTKLKAVVLPEANDDLCFPNRFVEPNK